MVGSAALAFEKRRRRKGRAAMALCRGVLVVTKITANGEYLVKHIYDFICSRRNHVSWAISGMQGGALVECR